MQNRLIEAKSDLLAKAASISGRRDHDGDEAFLRHYYRHVAPEDLVDRDPVDVYGAAATHRQMAASRPDGTALVRVYTPTVEVTGWSTGRTVVEIVIEDMPFLVDSVTMALTRSDKAVHLVIHPQIVVRRDVAGNLLEVCDFTDNDPQLAETPDAIVESWMHVEVDRFDDEDEHRRMEDHLQDVLREVREAVEDWSRMHQRASELADELDAAGDLPVSAEERHEASELLRWLADDHFTFLGYREYELDTVDGEDVLRTVTGSGLGILRADQELSGSFAKLPPKVREKAREPRVLVLTKANSKSMVHRSAYMDYIGIKSFGPDGEVTGERRFLGLFTSTTYNESVMRVPVLRRKVQKVLESSGFNPSGHSGKDLLQVLETYPRDDLFQATVDELLPTAVAVVQLQERRELRVFVRRDDYARFLSFIVYLPRERYNTDVRQRFQQILLGVTQGATLEFTVDIGESMLARLHFVVRMPVDTALPEIDVPELEKQMVTATRTWRDDFGDTLTEQLGGDTASRLMRRYHDAFPEAYKEDFEARTAVADVQRLEALPADDGLGLSLYEPVGSPSNERRFTIYRTGTPVSLTQVLPILSRMGVDVMDERPYEITRGDDERPAYIYDFGLRFSSVLETDDEPARQRFTDTFRAIWRGDAESDEFNTLVPLAGLSWRQASVLRAYAKFLRQGGSTFSESYLQESLTSNVQIASALVDLFEVRFDPDRFDDDEAGYRARTDAANSITEKITADLDAVVSLDQDRILRAFLGVIGATLRTNYYRLDGDGQSVPYLSMKLDSLAIPDLPEPRPMVEVFVYSPRVEGVHLRFGTVARGGLRWSDRREDFRTEVLGLVKAQAVKNAVIVPVGAKGGFVGKRLPDPSVDREAWMAEGIECYKTFIRGMLDITDNRASDRSIVMPSRVVRHDGNDPYLVVAADKGTAAFSDIANEVSQSYGFWLGDAFASGGSAGYDHKAMGITARGAWESVKRHFRAMGRNSQTEDFTCVGIGDMSGDVFGNGMLRSRHIRLLAAFDHRHIFLDPNPDAATSYDERKRLFDLPRSTWESYDPSLISEGGGVFSRSAKEIPISPQVREALGMPDDVETLTPAELMKSVLTAPVDLLWNGGIGTYVKASTESNASVGDKANDAIRVDGVDLRCRCVGEGGNLGFTQLGRVEYARNGTEGRSHHINTDAIDNSAGVDSSDAEVNIKILLDSVVRNGDLTGNQRNEFLAAMTEDVADLVLAHNYRQNLAMANAEYHARHLLYVHRSYISELEAAGELDREIEFLPSDKQLATRQSAGSGLSGPELSVLLAYTKNIMYADLLETSLPDDPYLSAALHSYFPSALRERYPERVEEHPLRREIVTNVVVNELVDTAGATFAFRLGMETGGTVEDLARAHIIAGSVFGVPDAQVAINALDNQVDANVQTHMRLEVRTIAERATRWLVVNRRPPIDIAWNIEFFGEQLERFLRELPNLLVGREFDLFTQRRDDLVEAGVPTDLAERVAVLPPAYSGLGMVENSLSTGTDLLEVARIHFTLGESLGLGHLLERIIALPRDDRWQTMARAALRDDLHTVQATLTSQVILHTPDGPDATDRVTEWAAQDGVVVERARRTLGELIAEDTFDLARLSVGLRVLRGLIRADGP